MRGVFTMRELPKPEYRALLWLAGELDLSQHDVIRLALRLLALFKQGSIHTATLHEIGPEKAIQGLLEAMRAEPRDEKQRTNLAPPHARIPDCSSHGAGGEHCERPVGHGKPHRGAGAEWWSS